MEGMVFDIQRYSIHDGPGIRTTIFFKGCPVKCKWCSNPESQKPEPELLYYSSLCIKCYRCVEACPNGANNIGSEGEIEIDRSACTGCGSCVNVCPSEARVLSGKMLSEKDIMEIVIKDTVFYRNSGGGVTLCGGEPIFQAEFALAIAKKLREIAIHCVLDTCGYVKWKSLKPILEYVDLIYYDIKLLDPLEHQKYTGVKNELILENLEKIVKEGFVEKTVIRFPTIPGYTDSERNIEGVVGLASILGLKRVDFIPYHKLGTSKYKALGRTYELNGKKLLKRDRVEAIKKRMMKKYQNVQIRIE